MTKCIPGMTLSEHQHFRNGQNLAMRLLTILFLLGSFLQVSAQSFNDITIKKDKANLETVFLEIEKQSEFRFFFNETLMKQAVPVTIDVKKVTLNKALDVCFEAQPKLTYAIVEKTIIVKRREVRQTELNMAGKDFGRLAELRGMVASEHGPVPGATISVKGTTNKVATTNNAGEFVLYDVDDKAVLVVSSVSHHEQEVRLNGRGLINIVLSEKVGELDEQIVMAYSKSTKKTNVGAVTVVKGEEVQNLPNRSIDKSLQGFVPGLLVTSGTGQPGGGLSNFVLRGIATGDDGIAGSTVRNPLIVIDGIPVSQDHSQWTISLAEPPVVNPMAQLNPSDIESITVLKDAAAIALYGSKASNGVILITTKKGKLGKTVFSFRHQTDLATRLKGKLELVNKQEYLELLNEAYKNFDPSLTESDIQSDLQSKFPTKANGDFYYENWEDQVYEKNALSISNELSISGGNEKTTFYLNFEYTTQNGIAKGTGYDRKSIRYNFENRPTDWFKIGFNSALSLNTQDYLSLWGNFPGQASTMAPLNPSRLEDGSLVYSYMFPYQMANPVAYREYNTRRNTSYRGLSKVYGELSFLRDFKFTSNLGFDFMLMETKEKIDPRIYDSETITIGSGRVMERDSRTSNLITTNTLRYDKLINNSHAINVLLGQEAQILSTKYLEGTLTNLELPSYDQIDNGGTRSSRGLNSRQTLLSYFGQVNYGFKNKYLLSASARNDGSSRFGERNRSGTYWSTGIGWVLTEESFMKKSSSWLDYLKIRGSVGSAGNSFAINRLTRFDVLLLYSYMGNPAIVPYQPGNPDIKWEQTFSWDIGLEARFWKNRGAFTADLYGRKTSDMIYSINLAPVTGWGSMTGNIGDMENRGVEFSISLDIVKKRSFSWNFRGNWSTNKNILVKANVPLSTISGNTLGNEEGRNFNSFYLVRWAGVDPSNGKGLYYDSTGTPNSDYYAAKKEFVGKPQPDGFGSIVNTFNYKNFSLTAMFYYQYGFQIFENSALQNDGLAPFDLQEKGALDRWKKPGDITKNPIRVLNNYDTYQPSTRRLFDGDFIRLQNLALSYDFPKTIIEALKISTLKIYAQAHNLAIWSKYRGLDQSGANVQGTLQLSYPNQRSFSLGLNLTF